MQYRNFRVFTLVLLTAGGFTTPLHDAVENNDVSTIRVLLNSSSSDLFNQLDENELTAVQLGAYLGHVEAIMALVEGGAPLEGGSVHGGMSALHWATGQGHDDTVIALVHHGAEVNAIDDGGRTALHYAASRGHALIVEALLGAGARVDACSAQNVSALQMASEQGYVDVVRLLLKAGAAPHAQADKGRLSALHGAAMNVRRLPRLHSVVDGRHACCSPCAPRRVPAHLATRLCWQTPHRSRSRAGRRRRVMQR